MSGPPDGTFLTSHLTTIYDDGPRWRELQSEATAAAVCDVCSMDSARLSKVMIRNYQTEKQCLWRRREAKTKVQGLRELLGARVALSVAHVSKPELLPNTAIRFDVAGKMIDDKAF